MTGPLVPARPATAGARTLAYLLDLAVALAAGGLAWILSRSAVLGAVVVIEAGLVLSIARAATGRTPGAFATRTAAHQADSAAAPGLRRQGVRSLLVGLLHLTGVGPLLTAATSREGRDWVDRIAGTAVADLRPAMRPVAMATDPYGRKTTASQGWRTAASDPTEPTPAPPTATSPALPPAPTRAVLPGWEQHTASAAPRYAAVPTTAEPPTFAPPATAVSTAADPPGVPAGSGPPAGAPAAFAPPAPPAAPPSSAPVAPAAVWAVLDSGLRVEVRGVTVLGREPSAGQGEYAVAVPDPGRSLSRTHVRLGTGVGGPWLEDAFSANGTSYRTPDGHTVELERGRRVHVESGTVVLMGDRSLTITIGT